MKSAEEFNEAVNSGLIDADNYYVHFRMIVAHILQLKEGEITAKRSRQSVTQLNKTTGAVVLGALAAIGAGVLIALTQKATGIAQEIETMTDDLPKQQGEIKQSETTIIEKHNQDKTIELYVNVLQNYINITIKNNLETIILLIYN